MNRSQKLIVGLGNPGDNYLNTRHNVGFIWLDNLNKDHQGDFKVTSKFKAEVASIDVGEVSIKLLKPLTYMNNSGMSVLSVANYYKITPEEILVVHDDLDLPVGVIKLKSGGGLGGHNGLKSIANCLSSQDFNRLRIGIGHPGTKLDVSDYVLSNASKVDLAKIELGIFKSMAVIKLILAGSFDLAMNQMVRE